MKTRTFISTSNTAAPARPVQIMFRGSTELATATTTQAELNIPAAKPFAKATHRAEPCWDGTDTKHLSPTEDASDAPLALSGLTLRRTVTASR